MAVMGVPASLAEMAAADRLTESNAAAGNQLLVFRQGEDGSPRIEIPPFPSAHGVGSGAVFFPTRASGHFRRRFPSICGQPGPQHHFHTFRSRRNGRIFPGHGGGGGGGGAIRRTGLRSVSRFMTTSVRAESGLRRHQNHAYSGPMNNGHLEALAFSTQPLICAA